MGHHFVPQAYLRNFETSAGSGVVWMYDRLKKVSRVVPIRGAAQSHGYYDDDVERQLCVMEGPAHATIQRLVSEGRLNPEDREALTSYVAVMLYRGPRRRRKGLELAPGVLERVIDDATRTINAWASTKAADDPLVMRRRAELSAFAEKFSTAVPDSVTDTLRSPWPSDRVHRLIGGMTWRIVVNRTSQPFITSDNPVFYFEGYGLRNPESELVFALSPGIALLADWQGAPGGATVHLAKPALVREANRRIVSTTERFIFANSPQAWVPKVANKARPFLSRIAW